MLIELRAENVENDKFFQDAEQKMNLSDEIDFANYENEVSTKTRARERNINKEKKIIDSLKSIENGDYGYCKETGEEIGLKRLLARPFTNLSTEAQEKKDFHKKEFEHALNNESGAKLYSEDE
jgi:DnaK suppressor protein